MQGRDSTGFRGRLMRIASPVNDLGATRVIVDSLDFHVPYDEFGSFSEDGDTP